MVERVARGRIMVPAAAALTVMAVGALKSEPAHAAGRQATLQVRVQVVEPCRIRIAPAGTLEQSCGLISPMAAPVTVRLGDLIERQAISLPAQPLRPEPPPLPGESPRLLQPSGSITPALAAPEPLSSATMGDRFAAANQRAAAIATEISQRVRYITVAY